MIDSAKLTRWYDFQARFYGRWRGLDRGLVDRVLALLPAGDALALLDAGCGTGLFAIGVARARPSWRIEGVDASSGMLRVARAQADRAGAGQVTFRQGDVTALPYSEASFDVVIAAGLLPNLNDPGAALAEFHRVLKPRGRLILVEFDRAAMGWTTRAFFRSMILGYRAVSWILPRYRFAEGWDIEASTVDEAWLRRAVVAAGFRARARHGAGSSFVLDLDRPDGDPA
jgi:ubiquinone/menaquinone biosynthesis C-methylase UbiE